MSRVVFILAISFWLAESRADDRFLVAAQINGKPVTLIFDTGTPYSVLWSNSALRLGLTNFQGGDTVSSATSEPCTVSIGKSSARMYFHVVELPPWATNMFDGILGWRTFKDNVLQLDAESHRLNVLDKLPAGIRAWSKVKLNADLVVLGLQVGGAKKSPADLVIDTGDEGGIGLPAAAWQRWRAENPGQPITLRGEFGPFYGYVSYQVSWAGSMAFGGVSLTEAPVSKVVPAFASLSNCVAVLGMAALKRLDVILDAPNGFAYFHAKATHATYFKHNGLGAVFLPGGSTNGPLIAHVLTNSPGWDAGVRNGDELLKTDGKDMTDWYSNMPTGDDDPPGTRVDYKLRRGTNIIEVSAVTRQILNCPRPDAVELTNASTTNQPVTNFFEGRAVRINSNGAIEYYERGYRYAQAGDFDRALADYDESIRLGPNGDYIYGVYLNRGLVYAKTGRLDSAIEDLTKAIRSRPTNSEAYYCRAYAHNQKREFDKALTDAGEAIRLDPTNTSYRLLRAKCYTDAGTPALARPDCSEVIRLQPTNSEAWRGRGLAYLASSNLDNAISDFEEAVRLGNTNEALFENLGTARGLTGKWSEAARAFTEAISVNPTNSTNYFYRGQSYLQKGLSGLAIDDFNDAIRLNSRNAQFFQLRSYAHELDSDFPAALKDLTEAMRLDPESALPFNNRGSLYVKEARYADALDDLHHAILLNPGDVDSYVKAAWLEATCTNAAVRNAEQAIKDATKACDLTNWKSAIPLDTLAAAYAESGNFPRAVELAKQALNLVEENEFAARELIRDRIALYEKSQPYREAR